MRFRVDSDSKRNIATTTRDKLSHYPSTNLWFTVVPCRIDSNFATDCNSVKLLLLLLLWHLIFFFFVFWLWFTNGTKVFQPICVVRMMILYHHQQPSARTEDYSFLCRELSIIVVQQLPFSHEIKTVRD